MSITPEVPAQGPDETIVLRDNFIPEGRAVPAGNGWTWIVQGWGVFCKAPGTWIGMMLVLLLIQVLLGLIPFIGVIVSVMLPVFVAGLVIASRTLDQGGNAQFGQLFAGFKHRFSNLALVGLFAFVIACVVAIVVAFTSGVWDRALTAGRADPAGLESLYQQILLALLIFFALTLPLVMATWFAPALIAFHEIGPVEAMKLSFIGCLKNMLPFLIYGLILLVPAIIATLPLGLGWLVLGPVTAASIYSAYRDIYFSRSAV